eukprot:1187545-Prorocentrum_minimum.AAC.11
MFQAASAGGAASGVASSVALAAPADRPHASARDPQPEDPTREPQPGDPTREPHPLPLRASREGLCVQVSTAHALRAALRPMERSVRERWRALRVAQGAQSTLPSPRHPGVLT